MTENNTDETKTEETNPTEHTTPVAASVVDESMTIGRLVKTKREEKGLSLKVISQQTKIHIGLLECLEADQFDKLPSKTYVRGFIKSTSKILNMDQELALHLLDMAYAKKENKTATVIPNKEMRTETARNTLSAIASTPLETVKSVTASSTLFLAKAAVVVLIVGVVGFNIKNFIQKSSEESETKLPEVLTTLHKKRDPAPKPAQKPVVVEPKIEEPIQVNLIQDKNQKNTDVTVNDINLKTISIGEKQYVEDTSMSEADQKELLPAKYRIQPVKGTENIFINASEGESWLTYKVDDKDIKKFVLRQGRTLFLSGKVIRLFLGNTHSLKVFYNNKLINLNATNKSGVKNLVIPEELKTKYLAPLFVFQDDGTVVTSDDFLKENQAKTKTPVTPAPAAEATKTPVKTKNL
ncbi:RodZ domain-containing protein [Bacteriovorax sp. PP10]|uniref:RodZ domain-containing protein n=1 Tax=Bacteriovorax antarcticus TaxID=3088717 RepID=A0ABU5VUK1_9BACT|nr:RodZ domain-containing protein [Bacteriovorax sp. PP10]MEA9356743.1 RodZ domain-containing protein [Bacteriovorax sp. PP10]